MVTESRFNYYYRMHVCVDCSGNTGSGAGLGLFDLNARIATTGARPRCQLFGVKSRRSRISRCPVGAHRTRSRHFVLRAKPRCPRMRICQNLIPSWLPTWNSTRTCRCRRQMTLLLLGRVGSNIPSHGSQRLKRNAFALVSGLNTRIILRSQADIET